MADHYRVVGLLADFGQIQLHAYDEHEEREAYLAEELQGRQRGFREQAGHHFREEEPEEGRAQYDARDGFTDNGGLPDLTGQISKCARHAEDHDDLQQKHTERMLQVVQQIRHQAAAGRRGGGSNGVQEGIGGWGGGKCMPWEMINQIITPKRPIIKG